MRGGWTWETRGFVQVRACSRLGVPPPRRPSKADVKICSPSSSHPATTLTNTIKHNTTSPIEKNCHKLQPHSYWKGKTSEAELRAALRAVDAEAWAAQKAAGVTRVALDGTYYDQMLDTVTMLGLEPARFQVGEGAALRCAAQAHPLAVSSLSRSLLRTAFDALLFLSRP